MNKGLDTNTVHFSVIVPVFSEAENLEELHKRLSIVMKNLRKHYEILFVDDGSTDDSFPLIKHICLKDKNTKAIKLIRNFGQHAALSAGLQHASGNVIITLDADLQNPPEEIPKLIDKLSEGYDLVFGIFTEKSHSPFRNLGSSFAKYVLSKIMRNTRTNFSTFRAIRSELVSRLNTLPEKNRFLDGLMLWLGAKTTTISVIHSKRLKGKTKYNLAKLVKLWFDMVTSFSDFPLKFATYSGVIFGIIGFILACFYLARKFILARFLNRKLFHRSFARG